MLILEIISYIYNDLTMKPLGEKYLFVELRAKGLSFDKISNKMNISKNTLISWSKEHKIDIINARELLRDAFQEQLMQNEVIKLEAYISFNAKLCDKIKKLDIDELHLKDSILIHKYLAENTDYMKGIKLKELVKNKPFSFNSDVVEEWTA